MASVVVDTDVVSFLFKRDTRAALYRRHLVGQLLIVSFMTVAELERWAIERQWGAARRAQMETHLQRFVIHPVDRSLCRLWAMVTAQARRQGRPLECADAWIAATALEHGLPLVTHNRKDYVGASDLTVISEAPE